MASILSLEEQLKQHNFENNVEFFQSSWGRGKRFFPSCPRGRIRNNDAISKKVDLDSVHGIHFSLQFLSTELACLQVYKNYSYKVLVIHQERNTSTLPLYWSMLLYNSRFYHLCKTLTPQLMINVFKFLLQYIILN